MKNFCQQKVIVYVDNSNIKENNLGMKKLHLHSKGNTVFAKSLINFIENWNESKLNLHFIDKPSPVESSCTDCKSESPISRDLDEIKRLTKFCELYFNKLKIAHIDKSSLRNKLDLLSDQAKENVVILILFETKTDKSFLVCQIEIDTPLNTPFWADSDQKSGGIMLYVREDLPAKLLLINRSLSQNLDLRSSKYDNYLVVGDFIVSIKEDNTKSLFERFSLKNLIKDLTSYNNPNNPGCTDFM